MNFIFHNLMFCFLLKFTGGPDVIGSHETIKVEVSHDAILPCRLQSPLDMDMLLVEWKHNGNHVHRFRSLDNDPNRLNKNFKDRTSLFKSEMPEGNVSLKLTNVTKRDAGNFTCDVRVDDLIRKCIVTLNVVDEKVRVIPDPTQPAEPVNQLLSIKVKITIPVVVIVVVLVIGFAIGFFVWKTCGKTNTEPEPTEDNGRSGRGTRRRRNKQKNKKKDNTQTVGLKTMGNTRDPSS